MGWTTQKWKYSIVTRDTVAPMNIVVPTKYPLSHYDRIVVFEIRLHNESLMLYRPVLHGNWNGLSLARRALKDNFPTPTVPLMALLPNHQVFLLDPVFSKLWYCPALAFTYFLMLNIQNHLHSGLFPPFPYLIYFGSVRFASMFNLWW
jgi:hypothetical protein